jgi:dipeptidyl-peptidase-4
VVTLHVRDLETGETVDVEWDRERFPYLASVVWPEEAPLTIAVQNRAQTELELLAVDGATGETTALLTETDPAWIDLDQSTPHWLSDGSAFLWSTERHGAWQLELREPDGSLRTALTTPADGYEELLGVDEERGYAYFRVRRNQIETHVARTPLDPAAGRTTDLTEGLGLHTGTFSDDGALWAHRGELASGERISMVKNTNGYRVADLPDAREEPLRDVNIEFITLAGPRAYRASVLRPADLDPTLRYPVIVRVYGGPTSVIVRPTETANALDQWYADQGFIVARVDGRGTPGRGAEWLREVKGDFISVPLADLEEAVGQLLARHPEMDPDRVGVTGWSWGGYFAAMAATRAPETFDAAVAGAPVTDWLDYDTHYTERYMGVPGEPGVDYEASSVLTSADQLDVPLLLIHGTADDNVYFTHSTKLADALFRAGREFEFLPLAGQTHSVREPGVVVPMHERIASFFKRTLGSPR